jgi:hypothetical protein
VGERRYRTERAKEPEGCGMEGKRWVEVGKGGELAEGELSVYVKIALVSYRITFWI